MPCSVRTADDGEEDDPAGDAPAKGKGGMEQPDKNNHAESSEIS